jgi:hypothetical protein
LSYSFYSGGHLHRSCNIQIVEPGSVSILANEILLFLDRDQTSAPIDIITYMLLYQVEGRVIRRAE